jgi:lipooligosaccharide transport system ATP-binding protein
VLELRFPPGDEQGWPETLSDLADRVEQLPDRLLLYAADGEAALTAAHRRGVQPTSTLEDVFLRLTGRSLVQ